MVGLKIAASGAYQEADLSDYFARECCIDELRRVHGVGKVQLLWRKGLRIWLDPMKAHSYGLSVADVIKRHQIRKT